MTELSLRNVSCEMWMYIFCTSFFRVISLLLETVYHYNYCDTISVLCLRAFMRPMYKFSFKFIVMALFV